MTTSLQGQYMQNLLSNIFSKATNSILGQLLQAIGSQLDQVDPNQSNLAAAMAVSSATGADLDAQGKDWNTARRTGESDDAYRARILALLPLYITGPTVSTISTIVKNFTGVAPIIIEYGPDSFTMGVSPMGQFVFNNQDVFSFLVKVLNPNGVIFSTQDVTDAINNAKPARSSATLTFDLVVTGNAALTGVAN